jgi:hypothetical protein
MVGTEAVYGHLSRGRETTADQEKTLDSQTTQRAAGVYNKNNQSKTFDTQYSPPVGTG